MGAGGPAYLAASSATQLVADCTEGVWTGPSISDHLYFSSDGGSTFQRVAAGVSGATGVSGVATPATGVALVSPNNSEILATFDRGTSWHAVYQGGTVQGPITLVGFTTASQGVAITHNGQLLMTYDGGQSWQLVPFG
jgi:photosystem II stability/assembly factor-like uncharacterized protein